MPWWRGVVVIAYASRTEDPGFEFRQGERLMKKDLMKKTFDNIYVDALENHTKRILKHALVAWRSGHPIRLQNRRSGFESRHGVIHCSAVVKT
jgi:hypothetical protein